MATILCITLQITLYITMATILYIMADTCIYFLRVFPATMLLCMVLVSKQNLTGMNKVITTN